MRFEIPPHADAVQCDGVSAWLWKTTLGWSLFQSPYQIDLENIQRDGNDWHTIDWRYHGSSAGEFAGGLYRDEAGHVSLDVFKETSIELLRTLNRRGSG